MTSLLRLLPALTIACTVAGCATYDTIMVPPQQTQPLTIAYSDKGLSGLDGPMGTYTLPKANVVITGHQSGSPLAGILFGPIGMLAKSAADSASGKGKLGNAESVLSIDVTALTKTATDTVLATGKFAQSFTKETAAGVLTIQPFALLTFVNDNDVRVWAVAATTISRNGKTEWSSRYFANFGKPTPLTGPGSLTENDGAEFKAQLAKSMEHLIAASLDDIVQHRARDEKKTETIEFDLPYIRGWRNTLPVMVLTEDADAIVVAPKWADVNVTAGIYVLDKSQAVRQPAAK